MLVSKTLPRLLFPAAKNKDHFRVSVFFDEEFRWTDSLPPPVSYLQRNQNGLENANIYGE